MLIGNTFLRKLSGVTEISPIFYQYVRDYIFKELIKLKYPVDNQQDVTDERAFQSLTYEEMNAIRYAAGSMPKKAHHICTPRIPLKNLLVCLDQFEETNYPIR